MKKENNTDVIDYDEFVSHLKNPNTTMTEDKLSDLKKKVSQSLSMDRQKLFMSQPFIGGMLMRMELVPIRDYRCGTACTDGNKIYFDIDFYKRLKDDERKFVLAHEIWHVIYMHFLRAQKRDLEIWNIATDCEINYMLKTEGFNPPQNLCFPPQKLEGKNAETIYEYYLKQTKGRSKQQTKQSGKPKESSGNKDSNKKNKSQLSGQFDKHVSRGHEEDVEIEEKGEGKKFSLPQDQWGEKGEDSDFRPQINSDTAEKIREMIVSEAQRYERTRGTLPGNLAEVVKKLRKPEISWKEYLSQFITKSLGDKRTWLPPNRHHVWSGGYFQSRRGEKIQVVVTVDVSGSTEPDLPKFMTELVSLLNTFGRYELTLIQCDANIQDVSIYDENNPFPVDTPETFKWIGMGGSDLNPAFKWIEENNTGADVHIVFTDGFIEVPQKDPLGIPTLFVLTSDGAKDLCDWGEKITFKDKKAESEDL